MEDHEEQAKQLKDLVGRSPVNWERFLQIDDKLRILGNESYGCSLSWVLSHYPPPHVMQTILSRYRNIFFIDDESIKTALDVALYVSSSEVIRFIANHCRQVKETIDESGDLPLHRARRSDIANILLVSYPEGVGRLNKNLELPLHTAVRTYQSPEHIRLLLEYGLTLNVGGYKGKGGIHVENGLGQTPFCMLCNQISSGVDIASLSVPLYQTDLRLWEKLKIMILIHFNVDAGMMHSFNMLHAILHLGCPPEALHMACIIIPNQIQQPNKYGRLPLSLAASQLIYPRRSIELLHHEFAVAINISDDLGRYPLHWAASGGRTFSQGTDVIFHANPEIAAIHDQAGMVPFMLAAASPHPSIETIYLLLRVCPHILVL